MLTPIPHCTCQTPKEYEGQKEVAGLSEGLWLPGNIFEEPQSISEEIGPAAPVPHPRVGTAPQPGLSCCAWLLGVLGGVQWVKGCRVAA